MLQRNGVHLPSMTALLAFESVVRHKSVTRAAAELCRTQSAISRQISTLENQLRVPLFQRVNQQLLPTEEGLRYRQQVCHILEQLYDCTDAIMRHRDAGQALKLGVAPSFCERWLIPRLPRFNALHPEVIVNVTTCASLDDFPQEQIDVAIGLCIDSGPEMRNEPLINERLILVGAPGTFDGFDRRTPILYHSLRQDDWRRYFAARAHAFDPSPRGIFFDQFNTIIQAAIAGAGIALVPDFLVQDELKARTLTQFDTRSLDTGFRYCLSYLPGRPQPRALGAFVAWIRQEAAATIQPALSS